MPWLETTSPSGAWTDSTPGSQFDPAFFDEAFFDAFGPDYTVQTSTAPSWADTNPNSGTWTNQ